MTRILSIITVAAALTGAGFAGAANADSSGLYASSGSKSGVWSGQPSWVQDAFKPKR